MIWEFSIKNYFSFKDESVLSMIPCTNIKKNDLRENIITNWDIDIFKTAVIYWPNASWKSTIFRAMFFLKYLVLSSHTLKPGTTFDSDELPSSLRLVPFLFNKDSKNTPSEFSISFTNGWVRYRYEISLNRERILTEKLFWYYNFKPTTLIDRESNKIKFDTTYFKNAKKFSEEIRDNQLTLSVCADKNVSEALKIYTFFSQVYVFMKWIQNNYDTITLLQTDTTWDFKNFLINFLRNADPSIKDFEYRRESIKISDLPEYERKKRWQDILPESKIKRWYYAWIHKILDTDNNEIDNIFPEAYESMWTQEIFKIAGTIYNVIKTNSVLFWDEFDKSLHPDLTRQIIKIIQWYTWGQFIFNTHDTTLLDIKNLFRRDQIWFVDKNKYWISNLYSLLEFKDKTTAKVETNYHKWRYWAIPNFEADYLF